MGIREKIDMVFDEATKYGFHVIGIKLTRDEGFQFREEILRECKFVETTVQTYRGARLIEGFLALVDNKQVKSGLLCAYIWNDYGLYMIKEEFIPLGDN